MRRAVENVTLPDDLGEEDALAFNAVESFTMTSPERVSALREAVRYVIGNDIDGSVVECGVWRGGSMMVVASTLMELGSARDLYLFDTFEGMPAPSALDVSWTGVSAERVLEHADPGNSRSTWCIADEADVRANMGSTGYPPDRMHFVRGKVEDTIPEQAPERIALLRLDTDWYESTRHELVELYPRLEPGGVLVIDDYGYWQGSRRAVDEFFATLERRPLLNRIDNTGRLAIKP